jgi:hypothetical protein
MARTTMSREEILRRSLLRAYPKHWQVILDGTVSTNPRDYLPLIYSKDFARAFWGENWEYHYGELLHRSDKLAYLAWFL